MKTQKIIWIATVALSCATLPVFAQAGDDDNKAPRDRDEAKPQSIQPLGDLRRASQIIGEEIKDAHDQRLGKVRDLALDLQNGRVATVIVARGGVVGMDEKLVAVPPESFVCDHTIKALRFKGSQEQLKNAPEFKLSEWTKYTEPVELSEAYQRFGVEPYFFTEGQPLPGVANQSGQVSHYYSFNGQNALPRVGYISRASRLMGTTAKNNENEKLGSVNNMVIDLSAGRVVEVILAEGGFLGGERELSAVPPQAFHWNADNSALMLDTTKDALRAAPHFKPSQWGYAYEPDSIAAVYRNYKVPVYFAGTSTMDNGAQNVRERTDEGISALEQGNAEDVKITGQIRQALQSNNATSADVANVTVVTMDGKVTLRGTVATEEEKRMIGDTAAKFVSADRVDNQIMVKTLAPAFHGY